jgi:hypothetical protein
MADNGWQRKFEDPIPLPDGRKLVTLRDAANYITNQSDLPEWQTAIEVASSARRCWRGLSWARLSERIFRIDKWSLCRG